MPRDRQYSQAVASASLPKLHFRRRALGVRLASHLWQAARLSRPRDSPTSNTCRRPAHGEIPRLPKRQDWPTSTQKEQTGARVTRGSGEIRLYNVLTTIEVDTAIKSRVSNSSPLSNPQTIRSRREWKYACQTDKRRKTLPRHLAWHGTGSYDSCSDGPRANGCQNADPIWQAPPSQPWPSTGASPSRQLAAGYWRKTCPSGIARRIAHQLPSRMHLATSHAPSQASLFWADISPKFNRSRSWGVPNCEMSISNAAPDWPASAPFTAISPWGNGKHRYELAYPRMSHGLLNFAPSEGLDVDARDQALVPHDLSPRLCRVGFGSVLGGQDKRRFSSCHIYIFLLLCHHCLANHPLCEDMIIHCLFTS